jgi:hypothetical protein
VEASCRFYIAVDKLGCSTFDSLLLFLFWLEARGHGKRDYRIRALGAEIGISSIISVFQPETPEVSKRARAALGMVFASSSLCVPARRVGRFTHGA